MKKEIAEKWVAALRSGDYTQQKGSLANLHRTEHCCLGVLCELAIKAGVTLKTREGSVGFDDERVYLPRRVQEWSGVRDRCGMFVGDEHMCGLISMNDYGGTFDHIADTIEKRWGEL